MAAETAVLVTIATSLASGLLKGVADKAVNAVSKSSAVAGLRSAFFGDLKPQLRRLERELSKLQALLNHAESTNPLQCNRNDLMLLWLGSVKEAAYFADNLLDDISYDKIRRQVENQRSHLRRVVPFKLFSSSDAGLAFRMKISRKVSKFMLMTAGIYKEAAEIGLRPAELVTNAPSYQPPTAMSGDLREVREIVDTSVVIGRQDDEDLIVRELCRANNNQVLPVVAVVGISGVGKTTLARKVYDNEILTKHFDIKSWIFVSDNFDLRRLLDEMLQSLTGDNHNLSNIGAMEDKLQGCLKQKSYLLVLDDVWNTDRQVWDSVRASLVRITYSGGSRVLLTTQSSEVASIMGASFIHNLKVLYDNDAWAMFGEKAFANKTQEQILDLNGVGRRILRKCGGLPLAIRTLGFLLASMNERSQWESIEKSELWSLPICQTHIMPWLLLSFNHLPDATVKQCFAHCSVAFQKGLRRLDIEVIDAWMAQGFIQPLETNDTSAYALGQTYVKTLLANGLLHTQNFKGEDYLMMHDLIHDLAIYISKDTTLIGWDATDPPKASGIEHVVVWGKNTGKTQLDFSKCNKLRTLQCYTATISIDFVTQARFLRVLRMVNCGMKEVPSSIGRLKHLRILNLSQNPIDYLPRSIGALYNLQTLSVHTCHRLIELPKELTKLVNLRHILTSEGVHLPKGFGQLKCLTTLREVNMKANETWKIKELQSLPLLRGTVTIKGLEHINSKEDAAIASLNTKAGITGLRLIWTSTTNQGQEADTVSNDEEVMDGLQPHSDLIHLWVENFRGKRFSSWLSEQLHCLKRILLIRCNRCEQLPALGQFRFLEEIVIDGMGSLEDIGISFFYIDDGTVATSSSGANSSCDDKSKRVLFPQLKKLHLWNMPKLKEWYDPSELCASAFPCLGVLHIKNCPLLDSAPTCFQSLKQLTMNGINSGQALLMVLSNNNYLTSLTIENVQHLTSLSHVLLKCTNLREIRLSGCKELTELAPSIQSLGALEILEVQYCDRLTSVPNIEGLSSLRVLKIWFCKELTTTPRGLESCVSIEALELINYPKLNLIPDLKRLSRLQSLNVDGFSEQISIPGWLSQLSCLSSLVIGGFSEELDEVYGIEHIPKYLRSLDLARWPKLKSLPSKVKFFTQLEIFGLIGFEGVEALPEWLGNLSSLKVLRFGDCENLKYLPPLDAMRRLTQLSQLFIRRCPVLEERCKKDSGEEWHKISRLHSIKINGVEIQDRN